MKKPTNIDVQAIFEQTSSPYLILAPDTPTYTILEVNDAYLKATMTKKKDIVSKSLFEIFPDNPSEQGATGVRNLRESLDRVVKNRVPDTMAVQKYDVRRPDGIFEERWWSPINTPVFSNEGTLNFIIHHVEDVTRFTQVQGKKIIDKKPVQKYKLKTEMLQVKKHMNELVLIGFLTSLLILIIVGILAYRNINATATSDSWERRTNLIILNLEQLLKLTVDAETGQRGFVITGDHKFLQPFNQALNKIDRQLADTKLLAKDDQSLLQHMKMLDSLVQLRLVLLKESIRLREIEGFSSARNFIMTGRGKDIADAIKREIIAAQSEQLKLLQLHSLEKFRAMKNTGHILIIGAILSFTVLILIVILLRKEISQRMKSEKSLQRTAKELEESNRDLEQFVYFVSHDLQEPLRAISSFLTFLKKDSGDSLNEDAIDDINEAVAGAGRMQSIIQDLLAFSRVTTKGATFNPTNMNTALDDAIANLYDSVAKSRVVIRKEKLPSVLADKTQMTLLFQNLIGNAIKYRSKMDPQIRIWAKRGNNEWAFAVTDNGIGIDPRYFETIFQIFQRLVTREEYPGTGVGLAVCKRIVERHGGRIFVESKPGEGSTFFFTIPDKG